MSSPSFVVDHLTPVDLIAVLDQHHRFWGERDLRRQHLETLVQQFPETCLAVRRDGEVTGYLIGFVTHSHVGYVHLIAVRDDARGSGIARRLWEEFAERARSLGATTLKAITGATNTGSVAFHTSIGFEATWVEDYAGFGEARIVFRRPV